MATTISGSTGFLDKILLDKLLIASGILSSLLYVAANIFIPMQYTGYSLASHTVSELSAIGAPTRHLWVQLLSVYSILVIGFGWGVWRVAGKKKSLRVAGILIALYAAIGFFWPPMHTRGTGAGGRTLTDTLHVVFTLATVPLMLLVIGFASAALGKSFRLYSVISLLIVIFFGALTGLSSPQIKANLPTLWMGVWERISIGAYMLWVGVLSVLLLGRRGKDNDVIFEWNRTAPEHVALRQPDRARHLFWTSER